MSLLNLLELAEPSPFLYKEEVSFYDPLLHHVFPFDHDLLVLEERRKLGFPLGFSSAFPNAFDLGAQWRVQCPSIGRSAADLLQIERFATSASIWRAQEEACLRGLAERVEALEVGFARAERRDRRFKWEAEAKGGKKLKWVAEAKADGERRVKWQVAEGGEGRTYSFEATSAVSGKAIAEKKGKNKGRENKTRIVEITDAVPKHGAVVLRKAFALNNRKGKAKQLSPQDAALIIQMNFRGYLLRRSQVLRALRALSVAKAKLKEIRALFSNFSYRRLVAKDAEECQKFSEKIIVLLLTVDVIEGADYMVRAARRSMVEELEAMLQAVDPQPAGKLGFTRRRKFDLPEFSAFQREMAAGVSEVVELINSDAGPSGL